MSPPTALSSLHLIQIAPESCSYPPPLPIKEPTKILQKFVLFDNSQASTMDTTPPSHRSEPRSRTKSASRLSRLRRYDEENESLTPRVSLEIVPSPRLLDSPTMSPNKPPYSNNLPLHELLLLSPSPLRKSRTRLADKLELVDDGVEPNGVRRRRRSRNSVVGASPRNNRRSRRRLEQEMREDRELGLAEEVLKPKKKRNSGKSKKDKLSLVLSNTTSMSQIIVIFTF